MVYLSRRQLLVTGAASGSSLLIQRNALAANFDFGGLKNAVIEKLGVQHVTDKASIRNIVASSLAASHSMPPQVEFKATVVSKNQNVTFNLSNDTRALNLKVTNPNGVADDLITIRTSEIWPGGDTSGVKASIKQKTVTFSQSGNYKLVFDGEYGLFNLFVGFLGWGCGLAISVNGTTFGYPPWVPDSVTGNGVLVHESFDFIV
jgi:hypothetical protein